MLNSNHEIYYTTTSQPWLNCCLRTEPIGLLPFKAFAIFNLIKAKVFWMFLQPSSSNYPSSSCNYRSQFFHNYFRFFTGKSTRRNRERTSKDAKYCCFKWTIPNLFCIYFWSVRKQILQILQQINVKNSIQYTVLGFEFATSHNHY